MKPSLLLFGVIAVLLMSGCSSGSAIAVGSTKPPLQAENVKLYITPPKKFEIVGLVEATGFSWVSESREMDDAINKLKEKAAELGANGILLLHTGDKSTGAVGSYGNSILYFYNMSNKTASGQAIFVTEE